MRLKRNKFRRRQSGETKKRSFFGEQSTDERTPFFSGSDAIQRKLNIGKSNDPQEKEAESAASKVSNKQVQKAGKKEEEQPVQKADKKEEEQPVQKADKKEDEQPVQKADKKEEEQPVQKADKKEEEQPVQKADKKEEEQPVQKADKKEEEQPIQKADKKEEEQPVQKADKKEEEQPVQKADKKEEEKPLQAKLNVQRAMEDNEAESVQAKTDATIQRDVEKENDENGGNEAPTLESLLARRKGRGEPLPDDIRKEMEKKFHTHFEQVRIHTDKEAEDICEQLHAMAFTHGYDIYFNAGQYNPNSPGGRELLAHELAHIVQQNG